MVAELYNVAMTLPSSRRSADALPVELFARLARNAPLLLTIGSVGVTIGLLIVIAAAGIAVLWETPLAKAAGAVVFFTASLFLTPSIHLLHYRSEIIEAAANPSSEAFTKVLRQQLRFWRFICVAVILWMALMATAGLMR
jgi:uncharacterized membrane protein